MCNFFTKCCEKSTSENLKHEKFDTDDATSNDVASTDLNSSDEHKSNALMNEEDISGEPYVIDEKQMGADRFYNMNHTKRGLALVFNHEKFDSHKPLRGTHVDRDRLNKTLKSLDFDVRIFGDLEVEGIKKVLSDVAAEDHTDNDCLMIVVLSHGELIPLKDRKGKYFTTILHHDLFSYLYATDNKYPLQMLWENFTNKNCPSLKNKPRIFLISACQGTKSDEGFKMVKPAIEKPVYSSPRRKIETDITLFRAGKYEEPHEKVELDRCKTLPQKDFLIVYSSMSGFYSYRDTMKGTWFIDAFCNVLEKRTEQLDLQSMLTSINRKVAYEYESDGDMKQMPCIVTMLTKLILFKKKKPTTNGCGSKPQ